MQRTYPVSGTEGDIVSEATPDYNPRETTFRGYSDPLQTLNVELVLIVPYGA